MIATIPFDGFYESIHTQVLDNTLDQMISDSNGDVYDALDSRIMDHINWVAVHDAYAKLFAENWIAVFNGDLKEKFNLAFESLSSPREYNFHTDRIFITVQPEDARRMLQLVDRTALAGLIRERFTSCSGFISHYPARLADWPEDVTEWDHNELGTLILALCLQYKVAEDCELTEDIDNNSAVTNILCAAFDDEGKRILKLAGYLREREDRHYR